MTIALEQPTVDSLAAVGEVLAGWQGDRWEGQLHPGDLGWRSMVGARRTAESVRLWTRDAAPIAIGMLDGSDLLRMAFAPGAREDGELAEHIADDLADATRGVLPSGPAIVEARGAVALDRTLRREGWEADEPWTPLTMDQSTRLNTRRLDSSDLHVRAAGLDDVDDWISVHWSAFKGTVLDEESRAGFRDRVLTMVMGPFATMARLLIGYNPEGAPAAVMGVWSLGPGRPGLVEPMGVHQEHRGRGYGIAITLAGALALRAEGASSVVLAAENSNAGAMATYRAAGFRAGVAVQDLARAK